jgi:hypothetical protein
VRGSSQLSQTRPRASVVRLGSADPGAAGDTSEAIGPPNAPTAGVCPAPPAGVDKMTAQIEALIA